MRTVTPTELARVLAQMQAQMQGQMPERTPGLPRVVASGNGAAPRQLLEIVDANVAAYRLFMLNAHAGAVPTRPEVVHETSFVGPGVRRSPTLSYVPARLSLVPRLFSTTLPPDVVCLNVAPPYDGALSLGTEVNVLPAAVEACRARGGLVIAQVNAHMPWTYGDAMLDPSLVDYAVVADAPLDEARVTEPDDAAMRIGELVAARIGDGATLQLGIGMVPDATLPGLAARRGLSVWSEMFSDGVLALDEAGALDDLAVLSASFLLGSQKLYSWVDRNPRVAMLRTETTNSPARIAAHPAMTSINTALQVDLFGQANASRINARIHSGFGGQTDFIVGALHSAGGQALVALRSWHPKADVSTIVAMVDEPVTSFQHTAVVTEQGVAEMFGHDERTQARHLIERAAHPRVRDELWEEAAALGLVTTSSRPAAPPGT
jgi:acyl-CoA hydrolase